MLFTKWLLCVVVDSGRIIIKPSKIEIKPKLPLLHTLHTRRKRITRIKFSKMTVRFLFDE